MNNGAGSAGRGSRIGPDAGALAAEMRRHEETRQSLVKTEATVKTISDDLKTTNRIMEVIRVQRDSCMNELKSYKATVQQLTDQIKSFEPLRAELEEQTMRADGLEDDLQTERRAKEACMEVLTERERSLDEAAQKIDAFEKRAQADANRLAAKDAELSMLREQLRGAREDIAQRDKKLLSADAEKKRLKNQLKNNIAEAEGHLQGAVVVVGNTVMKLDAEIDRLMAAISSIRTADPEKPRQKQQKP